MTGPDSTERSPSPVPLPQPEAGQPVESAPYGYAPPPPGYASPPPGYGQQTPYGPAGYGPPEDAGQPMPGMPGPAGYAQPQGPIGPIPPPRLGMLLLPVTPRSWGFTPYVQGP